MTTDVAGETKRQVERHGDRVHFTYHRSLKGYAATLSPAEVRRLAKNARVKYIEPTSPHVAGAAAQYLQAYPTATAAQVGSALIGATTRGRISNPGANTPNRLLFTR